MKKDNWLFVLIAVLLLITLMHGADAQTRFKENYKLKVQLSNGRQLRGKILEVFPDSLIILEKNKIVTGCHAKFRLSNGINLKGEVIAITDSTFVIRQEDLQDNHVLFFRMIIGAAVNSYPSTFDERKGPNTTIPVSHIKRIVVSSKKRGTKGFLLGAVSLAAIGYGIGYATHTPPSEGWDIFGREGSGIGTAILLFPIGGAIGSAIARDKTYLIERNPLNFDALVKELTKPVKQRKDNRQEKIPMIKSELEMLTVEQQ